MFAGITNVYVNSFFSLVYRMKAYSLPPLYRFTKQNENVRTIQLLGRSKLQKHRRSINKPISPFQTKSVVNSTDRADTGESKNSPPRHSSSKKEHLSSIVREISQARLISLRKKRSGQSMTLSISDNGNLCAHACYGCRSCFFI